MMDGILKAGSDRRGASWAGPSFVCLPSPGGRLRRSSKRLLRQVFKTAEPCRNGHPNAGQWLKKEAARLMPNGLVEPLLSPRIVLSTTELPVKTMASLLMLLSHTSRFGAIETLG